MIDNGVSNELPSPTDIDTFDIPTAPGNDIESRELDAAQKEEQSFHKTEDAKPADENQRLTSTTDTDGGHTPRLPGAVSPTNETPEMRKKLTPFQPTQPDLKTRQPLAPLKKMPISRKKNQRAVQHSKSPPEAAAAYNYVAESHLAAISRLPNQRLDSPRLQHRKKEILPPIGMTSLTKDASNSPTTTTAENGLTSMFSEIDQELETCLSSKKTPLDTSTHTGLLFALSSFDSMFVYTSSGLVQNPGFEVFNKVELLVLQRQLAPVSQHWYKIGLQLKISESRLNMIKELHWKSNEKSLHQVCKQWLSIESEPTWDKVVMALRGGELVHHTQKVAEDINSRFCQDTSSGGTPEKSVSSDKSLTMVCERNRCYIVCEIMSFFTAVMTIVWTQKNNNKMNSCIASIIIVLCHLPEDVGITCLVIIMRGDHPCT